MDKTVCGKAFVLSDNVDTDQIIPAEFLSYNPGDVEERKFFGRYAMSGVPPEKSGLPEGNIPFVEPGQFKSVFSVVIAGKNFGCGSSREHAPLAIAEAGVRFVIAESYARIFYRNSINGGYLAPLETPERLIETIRTGAEVEVDMDSGSLKDLAANRTYALKPLGDAGEIVEAGGIFAYARRMGMLE